MISSTHGSGSSAGIKGLILSPLLCGLRTKIDGWPREGIKTYGKWDPTLLKTCPCSSVTPSFHSTQTVNYKFRRTWYRDWGQNKEEKQQQQQQNNNKKISTVLKKIRWDLRKVKPEFLAACLFHKQAKAEAIICEGRRELLAPVRFDFSGRNWISSH